MEDLNIVNYKSLLFRVLVRFVRGFAAGALSSMALVAQFSGSDWSQMTSWLSMLAIAGVSGGITGAIMALDKWVRG
jgi:hypothetical protein